MVNHLIHKHVAACFYRKGNIMVEKTLTIDGMSCQHCVMAVRKELELAGGITVQHVEVGKATISYDIAAIGEERIRTIIEEAGYELTGIR